MERFTKKLSVLVPLYNEENTIKEVLDRLHCIETLHEVIIADDCSTDMSPEIVRSYSSEKIKYIRLHENSGKTAAINKAKQLVEGDVVIIQDADLEYDPSEIESVLRPLRQGEADVVYGSRFLDMSRASFPYRRNYRANRILTFITNLVYRIDITDVETCYKAFRAPILINMVLESSGFGMEIEITAMISRLPVRITEVPISYKGRTYDMGKKIRLRDGLLAIWYVIYFRFGKKFRIKKAEYLENISQYLLYR